MRSLVVGLKVSLFGVLYRIFEKGAFGCFFLKYTRVGFECSCWGFGFSVGCESCCRVRNLVVGWKVSLFGVLYRISEKGAPFLS